MTFETDMMSSDPDILVWLIHRMYLVYEPLTFQKMKGPTHLIRDNSLYFELYSVADR